MRERNIENGRRDPSRYFFPLGSVKYTNGKIVHVWTFEGDSDPSTLQSNTFQLEWPPHSGRMQEEPEMDRFAFCPLAEARQKILPTQAEFIDRLEEQVCAPDRNKPRAQAIAKTMAFLLYCSRQIQIGFYIGIIN